MADMEEKKTDEMDFYKVDESSVMPFFESHLEEISKFMDEKENHKFSLLEILKQFVRIRRLPFNMQHYMSEQSDFIRKTLQDKMLDRQVAVSRWIQENAGKHRDRVIQIQCLYLDKIQNRIVPQVQKLLEKHRSSQK